MSIKPILFNTEMVRAILDGRKTVTRRVIPEKIQDAWWEYDEWATDQCAGLARAGISCDRSNEREFYESRMPYRPGDILYVRETWCRFDCSCCEGDTVTGQCLKAPDAREGCYMYRSTNEITGDARWRSPMCMPREAARIWLRVTDVRVERLHDSFTKHGGTIFEIRAEVTNIPEECRDCIDAYGSPCCIDTTEDDGSECGMLDYPRSDFADLWDSTIKPADRERYGWAANPWVWVIAFERCSKPEGEK